MATIDNPPCHRSGPVRGVIVSIKLATPTGFEPAISTVTGWHVKPLHHGADLPDATQRATVSVLILWRPIEAVNYRMVLVDADAV